MMGRAIESGTLQNYLNSMLYDDGYGRSLGTYHIRYFWIFSDIHYERVEHLTGKDDAVTVICWDGKTLVADRMNVGRYNTTTSVTKIRKIGDDLFGISGNTTLAMQMFDWFERGEVAAEIPKDQLDPDKYVTVMRIKRDGSIVLYESSSIPIPIHERVHAIGAGADFARGAMAAGADALRAVEITIELGVLSGNGTDTLTFDEKPDVKCLASWKPDVRNGFHTLNVPRATVIKLFRSEHGLDLGCGLNVTTYIRRWFYEQMEALGWTVRNVGSNYILTYTPVNKET